MIDSFRNIFAIPDLRKRVFFTFALSGKRTRSAREYKNRPGTPGQVFSGQCFSWVQRGRGPAEQAG